GLSPYRPRRGDRASFHAPDFTPRISRPGGRGGYVQRFPVPDAAVRSRNVIFAAPRDDPRARRPADAAVLVLATIVMAGAGAADHAKNDLDGRLLRLFGGGLPGWISATFTIAYLLSGIYTLGLIVGIAAFGRGRGAV